MSCKVEVIRGGHLRPCTFTHQSKELRGGELTRTPPATWSSMLTNRKSVPVVEQSGRRRTCLPISLHHRRQPDLLRAAVMD